MPLAYGSFATMHTARRHALCIASITKAMPRGLSTLSIVCAISAVILS